MNLMFNTQTIIITLVTICLLSYNWGGISVYSKKATTILFCSKIIISFTIFYYFSTYLNLDKKNDLYVYYNQALKLYDSLNGNAKSVFSILIGNTQEYKSILNQLTSWKRDFDYGIPNDNQTMIRIHLSLILIFGKSILNHLLLFHLVSFTAILLLIKFLVKQLNIRKELLLILFILPSITIWSNTTFKESIALSIHIFMIFTLLKIDQNWSLKYLITLVVVCLIHIVIKPIYLIAILPYLLSFLIYKRTKIKYWLNRIIIVVIIVTSVIISLSFNHSDIEKDEYKYGNKFNLFKMIEYKQDDFFYEAYLRKAETLLRLTPLKIENLSFLSTLRDSILNVFFTPSFFYPSKLIAIPFLIENIILYLFIFIGFKKRKFQNIEPIDKLIFLSGITICIFAGIITPVLGIVLKFKSIGYLYLLIGLLKINFQKEK